MKTGRSLVFSGLVALPTLLFGGLSYTTVGAITFSQPRGIAIDDNGNLIVTGFFGSSAAVARIDPTTSNVSIIASGGNFSTAFNDSIVIAPNGDIYVNEFGNRSGGDNRITLVDPVTGAQTTIVKGGIFAVGAGQLGGIVIDRNGIYFRRIVSLPTL